MDSLDNSHFWLAALLEEKKKKSDDGIMRSKINDGYLSGFGSPWDLGGSPVESVVSSTETTESNEEEDFIAELTRQMAQATLEESKYALPAVQNPEAWGSTADLPESTPWAWNKEPNSRWDLLFADAVKVSSARKTNLNHSHHHSVSRQSKGLLGTPTKPNPNRLVSHIQANPPYCGGLELQKMKEQQLRQLAAVWGARKMNSPRMENSGGGLLSPSTFNGRRAVFLGSNTKKECAGTGVFLPRRPDSTQKKTAPPMLVPAKVGQAVNMDLDHMRRARPQFQPSLLTGSDVGSRYAGNNVLLSSVHQQKAAAPQPRKMNHEIRLPQEWTY